MPHNKSINSLATAATYLSDSSFSWRAEVMPRNKEDMRDKRFWKEQQRGVAAADSDAWDLPPRCVSPLVGPLLNWFQFREMPVSTEVVERGTSWTRRCWNKSTITDLNKTRLDSISPTLQHTKRGMRSKTKPNNYSHQVTIFNFREPTNNIRPTEICIEWSLHFNKHKYMKVN